MAEASGLQTERGSDSNSKALLRHGVGVFGWSTWIIGMLQAMAATGKMRRDGAEAQFRTAHVGGTLHAAYMLAMAGALSKFTLSKGDEDALTYWTIMMGWTNSLGYGIGAMLGKRGLEFTGFDRNLPPLSLFLVAMYSLFQVMRLSWKGSRQLEGAKD